MFLGHQTLQLLENRDSGTNDGQVPKEAGGPYPPSEAPHLLKGPGVLATPFPGSQVTLPFFCHTVSTGKFQTSPGTILAAWNPAL